MVNMGLVGVRLSDDLYEALSKEAESLGVSVSELVRELIREHLSEREHSQKESPDDVITPDVGTSAFSPRDHYPDVDSFMSYRIRLMWQPRGRQRYYVPLYIYAPRSAIFPGYPVYIGNRFVGGLVDSEIDKLLSILRGLKQ